MRRLMEIRPFQEGQAPCKVTGVSGVSFKSLKVTHLPFKVDG